VGVDERLVAVDMHLLGVRVEDDVLVEVAEGHLVVDAVGLEPELGVEPVAQRPRRRVVDRVVDRPPGLAVDLRADVAQLPGHARVGVGLRLCDLVVGLDDRRPLDGVVGRAVDGLGRLADARVLAEAVAAVGQQRVAERVGLRLAVEVVAGGERPGRAHAVVEAQEGLGLGLRGAAVGPEGVAEVGPVAVGIDPVAVVALEEDAATLDAAAPPAVGVGIGEVDDRLPQHVGERRRAGAHRGRHDRLAGQPRVVGGDEVLHRARAALGPGALDAVDRQRERVALLARVGDGLVGHAHHDEVALLACERRGGQAGRRVLRLRRELELREVVAREHLRRVGLDLCPALRAVADLAVEDEDLHVARPARVHVPQRVDELVDADERRRRDRPLRAGRAHGRLDRLASGQRVGEDPPERHVLLVGGGHWRGRRGRGEQEGGGQGEDGDASVHGRSNAMSDANLP